MNNITINDCSIRLTVNNDSDRVIEFDPEDLSFVQGLYDLIIDFEKKEKEFKAKDKALSVNKDVDKYGVPCNMGKKVALGK